uniref:MAGE domain-containing protein n=1 Tax=Rousettus aegyptiacus TaxID=9407 RepID=A0A7J8EK83_ROUAE|nr:hypothetical protein HJG63_012884 [Rousettus aegyptiacus]
MQGLEVAQVSKALEETHLSSHPAVPGNLKEAPGVGTPHAPKGPQSSYWSSIATTATSSSHLGKGSGGQEGTASTSWARPGHKNVPIDAIDKNAALLVNFMLFKYRTKEPITKTAMLKSVIKEYEDHFIEIFQKACEYMEMIFGLDVKEGSGSHQPLLCPSHQDGPHLRGDAAW